MGRLRLGRSALIVVVISLFCLLPACGGHKPPGPNPFPVRISLNPSISVSIQAGTILQFFATAQNGANTSISPTFTFASSDSGILDVAPSGTACAGTWNAPVYTVCTPAGAGVVHVTASALGATSPPTLVFVHPPIDNIQVSVVPPVNSPPPACPNQGPLPAACNLKFNANAANFCLSQNQIQTLQATAYRNGVDITASVGPFSFTEVETCPVQCIALELGVNGSQSSSATSFVVNKGTSEIITATAVDVQGCIVPKPPLTWVSSEPAALSAGGGTTGCAAGTTCTVSTLHLARHPPATSVSR